MTREEIINEVKTLPIKDIGELFEEIGKYYTIKSEYAQTERFRKIWNDMAVLVMREFGYAINIDKKDATSLYRSMVYYFCYNEWIKGISFNQMSKVSKFAVTTIINCIRRIEIRLKMPKAYPEYHEVYENIQELYNKINGNDVQNNVRNSFRYR